MKYVLNVFSPETHPRFSASDRTIAGFRVRHRQAAERLAPGDVIVCYLTRLSRWVGLLEVVGAPFEDATPLFVEQDDPFVVRVKVKPLVWLSPEHGIPIHDPAIWSQLSFTKGHSQDSTSWTGAVRTALAPLAPEDGALLASLLSTQAAAPREYPLEPEEAKLFESNTVRRVDGQVPVSVPRGSVRARSRARCGGLTRIGEGSSPARADRSPHGPSDLGAGTGPLSARCTFLAYDAVRDLADLKHLEHLSDSVIEEYEESAVA